jgi:DNA-binding transcriptional ArsR family regulator
VTVPIDDALRAELGELTATLCRALNDPKRLLLLYALADGPRTVGELTELVGASQTNVSQHLAVLRERGIVEASRDGANVRYALRYPRILEAVEVLRGVLAEEVDRRRDLLAS